MLELMKDSSPTDQDKYKGYSALHVASGIVRWDKKSVANRADMIKRMLEHDDCDPNIKDVSGMTPLHWCAWVAKHKVDVIISAMCTPRRDSNTGTTNVVQIDPDVQDCTHQKWTRLVPFVTAAHILLLHTLGIERFRADPAIRLSFSP